MASTRDLGTGILLFAHGARDPRWAHPFERLLEKVRTLAPDARVSLAFLEAMTPDLGAAVDRLCVQGCGEIRVVPIFLGEGGHVREDMPRLIEAARQRHPDVRIDLVRAVGEDAGVLAAIASYAVGA